MNMEVSVCSIEGCNGAPTLARRTATGWLYFCNKHREDKRKEYQRNANWRHKMKTKHGIDMGRRSS